MGVICGQNAGKPTTQVAKGLIRVGSAQVVFVCSRQRQFRNPEAGELAFEPSTSIPKLAFSGNADFEIVRIVTMRQELACAFRWKYRPIWNWACDEYPSGEHGLTTETVHMLWSSVEQPGPLIWH
jgi:hypothetical protein